ncbi:MAG TPA: zinc ribbon domain-containing protein [Nevskiaceae bacterium]
MPIHEYLCSACGQQCELLEKLSDPPARRCPHCGKNTLHREISAAGFRLKGTGWYETDFKSSNRHNVVDSAPTGSHAKATAEDKPAKKTTPPAKAAGGKTSSAPAVSA